MNVTVENMSPCRKRVKFEVPADRVAQETELLTDEFQKHAAIPGFRPGKTPRAMIQKRFQKEIEEQLKETLMPKAFRETVQEKKWSVVGTTGFQDVQYQKGLSLCFTMELDMAPDFNLPEYKSLTVKAQDETVTDEELTQGVKRLLQERATYENVAERALQMDDYAVIDYKGTLEGKPLEEVVPQHKMLQTGQGFWIRMQANEFLPGFIEGIVGMKPGDKRDVNVSFPADSKVAALAGKQAVYAVELKEIKEQKIPELTEDIAKAMGAENVEKFRESVRGLIELNKKAQARSAKEREIIDQLMSAVQFELPESHVNQETHETVYNIVSENQERGVSQAVIQENKKEILENATRSARDRVKLAFILRRIAEAEKMAVDEKEVATELSYIAESNRVPMEKIIQWYKRDNNSMSVERQLIHRKVLRFLVENAKTK